MIPLLLSCALAADVVPWGQLEGPGQHAASVSTGLEDAFTVGLGYRHVLPTERPVVLTAAADLPWATFDLADHRLRLAAATPIVSRDAWTLAAHAGPSWRRTATASNTMGSLGLDVGLQGMWTGDHLFAGAGLDLDTALSTRIVHTDAYRTLVYEDAVDGWYRTTGARLRGELQLGAVLDPIELSLRLGQARSLRFETGTIPAYAVLQVGWRWGDQGAAPSRPGRDPNQRPTRFRQQFLGPGPKQDHHSHRPRRTREGL
jgi:hypothetical protein